MGKLIVIEGLDGSGKATQTKLLYEKLLEQGKNVRKISFPSYESNSSALVKMYLGGEFGTNPNDVNAYAASVFYSVDRYASYKKDWADFYDNGGIILADRYTTSNAVHQCSKLCENDWDNYLSWLFDLEYNKISIPTPDMVIFLDMSPEVSQRLMTSRYKGNEDKKDIHEKDTVYLEKSRKAAYYCAKKLGWHAVHCDDGQNPFTIEKISSMVIDTVSEIL